MRSQGQLCGAPTTKEEASSSVPWPMHPTEWLLNGVFVVGFLYDSHVRAQKVRCSKPVGDLKSATAGNLRVHESSLRTSI